MMEHIPNVIMQKIEDSAASDYMRCCWDKQYRLLNCAIYMYMTFLVLGTERWSRTFT